MADMFDLKSQPANSGTVNAAGVGWGDPVYRYQYAEGEVS
jgi:hypothetical protein